MYELQVVAKRPAAGHTKTRLCPPLTGEMAATLYEAFLRDTLDIMRQVPDVQRTIGFLPEDADTYFAELAPDFKLVAQHGTDLGERLANLLSSAFANGATAAIVIGSDSPNLPVSCITDAFRQLEQGADVVLGPSADGGYYLIGLRQPQPRLLCEVPMSTPTVLAETLQIAAQLKLQVGFVQAWYDVDTITELQRLQAELRTASAEIAPHTRSSLRSMQIG